MKRTIISSLLLFVLVIGVNAQDTGKDKDGENDDYKLDLLQAPASPAANLIGTAPTEVQTFTDPTAFMVSLQNGARNFDGFPKSYAVDIAPAWLFWGKNISYAEFKTDNWWSNIKQSFVLSFAYTNTDSVVKQTDMGIGFKLSLRRGKINSDADTLIMRSDTVMSYMTGKIVLSLANDSVLNSYDSSIRVLKEKLKSEGADPDTDDDIIELKKKMNARIAYITAEINKSPEELKSEFDSLKKFTEKIDFKRTGFKIDLAGGTALKFPGQVFNYSLLSRAGVWLTAGWDFDNGMTAMGILRYTHNPDKIYYDNDSSLYKADNLDIGDAGARLQYEGKDGKFLFGGEIIYRTVLNPKGVAPAWRYIINCDYQVKKNTHLTLTLGRDFDGTFNKDGNLIAALNLIFGLGNTIDFDGE